MLMGPMIILINNRRMFGVPNLEEIPLGHPILLVWFVNFMVSLDTLAKCVIQKLHLQLIIQDSHKLML